MRIPLIGIALVTAAAMTANAQVARASLAPASKIWIEGTSNVHDWKMEAKQIDAQIELDAAGLAAAPAAMLKKVTLTIPVTALKSEHAKMDKLMAEALKAQAFPEIKFEMTSATPRSAKADAFTLETKGKLTIAGVTRDVAFDVQGTRNADGKYTLIGQAPIRMSQYGIKPPTAMMGTIKTGDDVKVTFRWIVEKTR